MGKNMKDEFSLTDIQEQGGFSITPVENVNFISEANGYRKLELSDYQKIQFSGILNDLPELIIEKGLTGSGLYRLEFPNGIDGSLMKLKQGGLSTNILGDNGRMTGSASLYEVNTIGPSVALGVFSIMSLATGQYFLAEINKKLKKISRSIDKILEFLYGDKKAELLAEISFTQYAYKNFSSISSYDQQRQATLVGLQHAKVTALHGIEFYISDLDRYLNKQIDVKPQETVDEAFRAKECLDLSMQLYIMSSLLEIYYSGNHDKEYIDYVKSDIRMTEGRCDKHVLSSFSAFKERMQKVKALPVAKNITIAWLEKIDTIVDALKENNEQELVALMDSALDSFHKRAEYCIGTNGELYVKEL